MKTNKRNSSKNRPEDNYLLSGKIYCGKCGSAMYGESGTSANGTTYRYYKCFNAKNKNGCNMKAISKEYIENKVLKETYDIVLNEETINVAAKNIMEILTAEFNNNEIIKELTAKLEETNKSLKNLTLAVENGLASETINKRIKELEQEQKILSKDLENETALNKVFITEDHIKFWFEQFKNNEEDDLKTKQLLCDTFIRKIILKDDCLEISYNLNTPDSGDLIVSKINLDEETKKDELGVRIRLTWLPL